MSAQAQKLILALDWYPNVNHIGILLAHSRGYYNQLGLDVELLPAHTDGYQEYPLQRLANRAVHIAMGPSEHGFYFNEVKGHSGIVAIGAIASGDHSAIAVKVSSGINSPKDLDGKRIACYGTYFEEYIMRHIIRTDGGKGEYNTLHPGKLELWEAFLNSEADACWLFPCWEGALAAAAGLELKFFNLAEYGVPYGQSPAFFAQQEAIEEKPDVYKNFIAATAKGYAIAQADPEQALNEVLQRTDLINKDRSVWQIGLDLLLPSLADADGTFCNYRDEHNSNWHQWLESQGCLQTVMTH